MLKLDFNERTDSQPAWLKSFQLDTDQLWRYPNRTDLETIIATDMKLPSGSVLLTNGGDESIELLYKNCKLNNQSLLIPEPCFSQYTHNQKVWQNKTIFTPASEDLAIDVDILKANMKANQWVILTRPNNPTGEYLNSDVLIDLIETAQANGAWVFLDEAYVEFVVEDKPIDYSAFQNLVTLRTFSKAFGLAGARIGYIFGEPELIQMFRKLAMPFNVSRVNLQLAQAAWKARDEIKPYCQTIAKNRKRISQLLEDKGFNPFPSQGNFLLFKVSPEYKLLFARYMQRMGIQIKTQLDGMPEAIRLTIPAELQTFEQAIKMIVAPELLAFDMDGVLIDTSESYDQCIIKTVAKLTGQTVTTENITALRARGGFNNDWDLAAELVNRQGIEVSFTQVVDTFQAYYIGNDTSPGLVLKERDLILKPLKNQLFCTLNNQSIPFKTAIVTGRPKAEAKTGIKQLNIKPDLMISADDVLTQKPSPEGLLKVMSAPEKESFKRTWFFGDTVDDIQAGTLAGCVCVGIAANTEADYLYQAGADLVLENINQFEDLL